MPDTASTPTGDPLAASLNDQPNVPTLRQVRDLGWSQWQNYIDVTEEDADIRNHPHYVAARRAADTVPLLVAALDRLGSLPSDSGAPDWPPATSWPDSYRRLVLGQE